ncbi:MAG: hypothetical protein ACYC7J_15175 [Syntrophales bacterium]
MNVVCYGNPPDELFLDTCRKIQEAYPGLGLEACWSPDLFTARLKRRGRSIAAVVLYIAEQRACAELLAVRPLLCDLPVVILLNDQDRELLKFAHELRPRVIAYTWWRVEDLCSILERCVDKHRQKGGLRTAAAGIPAAVMSSEARQQADDSERLAV